MTNSCSSFLLVAVISGSFLAGCGKEAGRVPFVAEGSQTATLPLEAGDVAFWTDIDLRYEGEATLTYRIDLLQGGSGVAAAECQALGPMSMKVGWIETRSGASSSRSGSGKMACSAQLVKSGPTVVQATLGFGVRPSSFTLGKADLVVKQ